MQLLYRPGLCLLPAAGAVLLSPSRWLAAVTAPAPGPMFTHGKHPAGSAQAVQPSPSTAAPPPAPARALTPEGARKDSEVRQQATATAAYANKYGDRMVDRLHGESAGIRGSGLTPQTNTLRVTILGVRVTSLIAR